MLFGVDHDINEDQLVLHSKRLRELRVELIQRLNAQTNVAVGLC